MAINEIQTNVNQASAYPVMQSGAKTSNTNSADVAKEQIVSNNTDTFTLSNSSEEVTGIYSPDTASVTAAGGTTTAKVIKNIPYSLAAKRANLSVNSQGMPVISSSSEATAYNNELNKIRNVNKKIYCNSTYRYSQTGNSYGYTNPKSSCATYALATAISIRDGKQITPKDIATNSSTDGHGTKWSSHGAYKVDNCTKSEVLLAVNAQLSLGNPVLIHATDSNGNGHWATVIGRDNSSNTGNSDDMYTIIDPYYGNECKLSAMQIYKNNGGTLDGYVVVSNKY